MEWPELARQPDRVYVLHEDDRPTPLARGGGGRWTRADVELTTAERDDIVTIEGLSQEQALHPMQRAFIEHDAFQCGYCTPGQILSAVALIEEARACAPSVVTTNADLSQRIALTDDEIRERMSGNICRCGAYVNILAAIRSVARTD